jgi:hypothetical protein
MKIFFSRHVNNNRDGKHHPAHEKSEDVINKSLYYFFDLVYFFYFCW